MTESISKEEQITLEEVMLVMEQTQEVLQYSKALEIKSAELEKATLQLTEANEQLKALDKLKADFITTVTHELRTPVTSIKSLAKIMLDFQQELSKEKLNSYLSIIVSESDRISRLINQVLDIEKLQSDNQIKQPMEPVQPEEIIRLVMLGMEQIFKEQSIHCTYQNKSERTLVLGHRDRLIQVVVNLVSNAVKFCNPNKGIIDISLQNKNNEVWITVTDNGQGIAPDAQEFIFEQFTQLNYPELGKPEGTGLGLFICRQIVTQHKGTISVKSSLGKGASFIVRLPELKM
jgi:signal transduction histidine kinase